MEEETDLRFFNSLIDEIESGPFIKMKDANIDFKYGGYRITGTINLEPVKEERGDN